MRVEWRLKREPGVHSCEKINYLFVYDNEA